eukprot:2982107-Amphidinium_carterae.1
MPRRAADASIGINSMQNDGGPACVSHSRDADGSRVVVHNHSRAAFKGLLQVMLTMGLSCHPVVVFVCIWGIEDLKAHLHRRGLGPGQQLIWQQSWLCMRDARHAVRSIACASVCRTQEQKRKTHGTHGTLVAMWLDDILVAIAVLA